MGTDTNRNHARRQRAWWVLALLLGCVAVDVACAPPPPAASTSSDLNNGDDDDDDSTAKKAPTTAPTGSLSDFLGGDDDDDDDDDNGGGGSSSGGGHHHDGGKGGKGGGLAIATLDPASVQPGAGGSAGLALTVNGSGFDGASVVVFDGTDVPTKLVSATSLQATVPSSLIASAGSVDVAVRGSTGTSSPSTFTIGSGGGAGGCGADFYACSDLGLSTNQCSVVDGDTVQCLDDGCVYVQCVQN